MKPLHGADALRATILSVAVACIALAGCSNGSGRQVAAEQVRIYELRDQQKIAMLELQDAALHEEIAHRQGKRFDHSVVEAARSKALKALSDTQAEERQHPDAVAAMR